MPPAFAPFNSNRATYSRLYGWFYETIPAPALLECTRAIGEQFLSGLPLGARVLDVGSGGGQFTNQLADLRPDISIVGIDLSEAQVQRARRRMRNYADRVHFQACDATSMVFEDCCFDGVISIASIKHWQPRSAGLAECLRVLNPGGSLMIAELDRGMTFESTSAFVAKFRAPRLLRGLLLPTFRTWIAGRSIDLAEACSIAGSLDLVDPGVRLIPETPLVMICGRKPCGLESARAVDPVGSRR